MRSPSPRPSLRSPLGAIALATLIGCVGPAPGDGHAVWQVRGETNTVYLLGSVHLLREQDYPLPAVYDRVYAESEELIMELDMDDLDPALIRRTMVQAGVTAEAGGLRALLGEQHWARAAAEAQAIDVDLAGLNYAEPWFAALTIVEAQLLRMGYDPGFGVELQFTARAARDGKPIRGLETVEQQIAFFDELPMDTQRRFLLKTLEDARELADGMDTLIDAWKRGDTVVLERELIEGFDGFPDVYRSLVVDRNARWAVAIEALLDDEPDYLVIVGALHLVGERSLVDSLRRRGYRVRQL